MLTITNQELTEQGKKLYKELGGLRTQNARIVRALLEQNTRLTALVNELRADSANADRAWTEHLTALRKQAAQIEALHTEGMGHSSNFSECNHVLCASIRKNAK